MLFKSESEVITILYITKNNYNSLKKTVTLQEVVNNTNIKYITLYKVIQKFIQEGYLKEGLKKGGGTGRGAEGDGQEDEKGVDRLDLAGGRVGYGKLEARKKERDAGRSGCFGAGVQMVPLVVVAIAIIRLASPFNHDQGSQ